MSKTPDIKDLFKAIQRAEALVTIYLRQKRELNTLLDSKTQRIARLQAKIDAIQSEKETIHLTALDLATARGKEFPAVVGRVYRLPNGVKLQVIRSPKEDRNGMEFLKLVSAATKSEVYAGFDPETLAQTLFYDHPKSIVVGAAE